MRKTLVIPENQADLMADRIAIMVAALFIIFSWGILSSSVQLEAIQNGQAIDWREPWLREFTSHSTLFVSVLIIPLLLTRLPLTLDNWKQRLPLCCIGFLIYTAFHILMMVALRKISYPFFLSIPYEFGLSSFVNWVYEMRKDLFSFIIFLSVFLGSRQIGQLKLEAKTAKNDAQTKQRLTLKCGGRTIYLSVDEVIWIKAASNYVEVHTAQKTYLARMTLAKLKAMLMDAGNTHTQCHRSYIVNRDAIREIIPTGDGDAQIRLTNGDTIPTSRHYRNMVSG